MGQGVFSCFWRTQVLFVGPLIPMFWTSVDVCPRFQSQRWIPCLHAFSPVVTLRFTSGVTPADCVDADSLAVEPFQSMHLQVMCPQALVGIMVRALMLTLTLMSTIDKPLTLTISFISKYFEHQCLF